MTVNPRRLMAVLAGLLLGLLASSALWSGPALAHASLVRTSPLQGSVISTPPGEILITFSEPVSLVSGKIEVLGPDGKRIDRNSPRVSGSTVHVPVRTGVAHGTFLVSYRVISEDSHPVGGGFTYSVGAPSASGPPKVLDSASRTDPLVATAVSVARYLGFAGLILVVGPALILFALWPTRLDRRPPTRPAYTGLGLIGVATLVELYLQAPYAAGSSLFDVSTSDFSGVLDSRFGQAHLVRLAVLVVSAFLLRPLLAGRSGAFDRGLLVVLGVIGVGTWSISGHPGTSSAPALTVVADVAHLSAVAVWLGGLLMLIGFPGWRGLLRSANARELRAILPIWSGWAMLSVMVLVLAGTAQALVQIGSVDALLNTSYGQLVVAKVGVLVLVLAVAAFSRRIVQRHTGTGSGSPVPETAAVPPAADGSPDESGSESDTPPVRAAPTQVRAAAEVGGGVTVPTGGPGETPASEPGDQGQSVVRRLRRSVLAEIVGAAVVLALAAVLVQTTPGHTAANASNQAAGPFSAVLTTSLYQLQVDVDPGKVGNNSVHLYAAAPNGSSIKVVEWKATAALPSAGLEPVTIPLLAITDSHATGEISLANRGSWQFTFTLRTTDIDEATVNTTVTVR